MWKKKTRNRFNRSIIERDGSLIIIVFIGSRLGHVMQSIPALAQTACHLKQKEEEIKTDF